MYPNRTLCEVLEEMRSACKTLNFSYLPGLIEEVQSMGNRMEAALGDKHDVERYRDLRSKLHKEVQALRKEVSDLKGLDDEDTDSLHDLLAG